MRRYRTMMLVALAAVAAAPLAAQEEAAAPKMVIREKVVDAGTVPQGEVVDVEFVIANEGTAPLEVTSVRPTCGCTVADYDREIPPGGTGKVAARLDTTDFAGPISKSILVRTNDPDTPATTLVIKTTVKPFVEVLPRKLVRFNAVQKAPVAEKIVVVGGTDVDDFKVTEVTTGEQYLEVAVRRLEDDERIQGKGPRQFELTLSVANDAPVGPVSSEMVVHTNHPKAPKVPVKVYGVVRALVHVTPPQIQFGAVEAKLRPGRNVIVVSNRGGAADMEITGVEVDDPAFSAAASTVEEGRRFQVTVTIQEDADPGARDATLTIRTTDPDHPVIEVPVRASLR